VQSNISPHPKRDSDKNELHCAVNHLGLLC